MTRSCLQHLQALLVLCAEHAARDIATARANAAATGAAVAAATVAAAQLPLDTIVFRLMQLAAPPPLQSGGTAHQASSLLSALANALAGGPRQLLLQVRLVGHINRRMHHSSGVLVRCLL
jgi:hypothetical protein